MPLLLFALAAALAVPAHAGLPGQQALEAALREAVAGSCPSLAFAVDPEHGRGSSPAIDDDVWRLGQGQRRLLSIFDLHKPVIAQVHGYCVGGGSDFALCADFLTRRRSPPSPAAAAGAGRPPAAALVRGCGR